MQENYRIICTFVLQMIQDELVNRLRQCLGHVPTAEQERAMRLFADFLTDREEHSVFVLRGSAGTGKTTLAAAVVRALTALQQKLVLMAPTGRAAKVFSGYAGCAAYTIHKRIYRQKTAGDLSAFNLNVNMSTETLFMVDEASMVSNQGFSDMFGSGCLLDDLIQFVYGGRNCRLVLIGDKAQLPPVGEEESPALMSDVLRGYGLKVYECDLNEVLRQAEGSGILFNATLIRSGRWMVDGGERMVLPKIKTQGFEDIEVVTGNELIETLATSYSRVGLDETMVVTRSNKRANIYNQGIRNMVLDREDELCTGDQIMIVKNNYFWRKEEFIANGDHAVVQRVRHIHELYGFRFAEVTMTLPDYDNYELTAMVMLDTLTSEAPALTREQQELLYNKVEEDYQDIRSKADRVKKIKEDKYYNALQIKFAYAATCHKTQGGQWEHIYIDQGYMTDDMLTTDYIHWLYTALTRATKKVFLVNWPKMQTE